MPSTATNKAAQRTQVRFIRETSYLTGTVAFDIRTNAVTGSPVPGPDGFNRKQTVVLAVTQIFHRLLLPCSSGKPVKLLVSKTQRSNDKLA